MKAIILAAGVGSRLTPITQFKPKSMVKVNNKPILQYQIDAYINAGVEESNIYIVTGYMEEFIHSYIREFYPKSHIISNKDFRDTNNMYSLYLSLKYLESKNDLQGTFLISNADCIYSKQLMQQFISCHYPNAIAVDLGIYNKESMKIECSQNNYIIDISKNIPSSKSNAISTDLYKYDQNSISELFSIIKDFIEVKKELNHWTELSFPILFKKINVDYFDIKKEKWIEIDNFQDLAVADKLFSEFNLKEKRAIICDLDGTIFIGNKPIEESVNFITNNITNYDFYFVTNNTSKVPADYVKKLEQFNIKTSEERVITPLLYLENYLKQNHLTSAFLIANTQVSTYFKQICPQTNFDFDEKNNQAIILTYDSEINYQKLKDASILLNNKQDIKFIATHSDISCPTEYGPIPDIGSISELLFATTGRRPDLVFGKPNKLIVEKQISEYGIDALVVVGDRLYTDKKLAENIGCDFVCVLSGETKRQDIENEKDFPSLIIENLQHLSD